MTRSTTGLIWGPCMPVPGSRAIAYVFTLAGEKRVYSQNEFTVFGETSPGARVLLRIDQGTLTIDRAKRRVNIVLTVAGKPWAFDGPFTDDHEQKPTVSPPAPTTSSLL